MDDFEDLIDIIEQIDEGNDDFKRAVQDGSEQLDDFERAVQDGSEQNDEGNDDLSQQNNAVESAGRDPRGNDHKENQQRADKGNDLTNAIITLYGGGITDEKIEEIKEFVNNITYPIERLNAELVKRYIDLDRDLPEPVRNKKREIIEGISPDLVRYHRLFTKN